MKHLILLATIFMGSMTFAQGMGDVTIYSNTGDKFYVVLNGIRQNDAPETNVKVTGLSNQWYECKIMSANNNFTIDKKILVKFDTLVTYRVTEKKGKYKLKYFTETPLGTATAVPDQTVVSYHPTENTTTSTGRNENVNTTTNVGRDNGLSTTTTTTTTSTTSSGTNENIETSTSMGTSNGNEAVNVNIQISENDMGADVNMNVTGTGSTNPNLSTTTTSSDMNTTTTTTSSSSTNNNGEISSFEETTTVTSSSSGNGTFYEETTTTTTTTGTMGTNSGNEGNLYQDDDMVVTMENNCFTTDDEVDGIVNQVKSETFSDDQARVANMAAESKCMNAAQITKVANAFTFEDNKLEFLKKAYDNCPDKSNYYQVMETLTFSADKEELQNYINSK